VIGPLVFVSSLMAMSPQWAIVDLPYPDIGYEAAAPATAARITEAVTSYAMAKVPGKTLARKPEISDLRVHDTTASLRINLGDRTEVVILTRVNNDWRVIQCLIEGIEY
jgi:hypothetical protein